jgi:Tol biopolymer transport system component
MKLLMGNTWQLLLWGLILVITITSCSPSNGLGQNEASIVPSLNLPQLGDVQEPHQTGQVTLPRDAEPVNNKLPLDIDIVSQHDQTFFHSFYGLLPELRWSPDGRYLAIFAEKNGYGLWLWDCSSGSARRLVQLLDRSGQRLTSLTFFGWSKDGRSLLYAVDGIQSEDQLLGQNGVLVRQVGLDGTDKVLAWLPGEGMFIRSWSLYQDTHRLLIHRGQDLWVVDTVDGKSRQIKADLPVWDGLFWVTMSPTGEHVVYPEPDAHNHRLVILDVDSGTETVVGDVNDYSFHPVWSPDGKKVAFLSASASDQGYDFQIGEDGPLPPATTISVVTNKGQLVERYTPARQEKAGAPIWSGDSQKVAFLSASVNLVVDSFPEVKWRRLLLMSLDSGQPQDLGQLSGDWITIGGFTPDNDAVFVYNYEAGGGVTVTLHRRDQKTILAKAAADEVPIWWQGKLVFPRLSGNHDDHLDTQLYLHDLGNGLQQLTDIPGWKSGVQVTDEYMAFTCADNKRYPYPLTVVVQPLPSI